MRVTLSAIPSERKTKDPRAVAFGRKLRAEMLKAGNVSSRELGRRLATDQLNATAARRTVMRYLSGDVLPSLERRVELADALGCRRESLELDEDEEDDLYAVLVSAMRSIARLEAKHAIEHEVERRLRARGAR